MAGKLFLLADLAYPTGPEIEIFSPEQNSNYLSTVTVTGRVSNQQTGGTAYDEVDTLRYVVSSLSLDEPVAFDPVGGTFSFDIDTSGYNRNLAIVLTAHDLNGRASSKTVSLLGDTDGPIVTIDSPLDNTYYRSQVVVTGTVRDRDSTIGSPTIGELQELNYQVGNQPAVILPLGGIDAQGSFTFSFTTVGLSGTIVLQITAIDRNARESTESIDLLTYATGPEIEIFTPTSNSSYMSTITVMGKVSDQNTGGASWDEVNPIIDYSVPSPYQTGSVTIEAADGTFTFDVDTTGYNGNISIAITAVDLNSRATSATVTLLGDSIGPTVEINSPLSNTRYESSVTVAGLVLDRDIATGPLPTSELSSVTYTLIGTAGASGDVPFDPNTGTFSFDVDTPGNTDNIIILVIATDKNARETISQTTLLPYADGPELTVTSPLNYSRYRSAVSLLGSIRDQSSTVATPTVDEVLSLSYSLLGTAIVDVPIAWNAAGAFSESFTTIGRTGTIFIELKTLDLNFRESTETIVLNDYDTGPEISISAPNSFSEFKSSVTVTGIVQDQDTAAFSTDEVASIRYSVPALGFSNIAVDAGSGDGDDYDSTDGSFNFIFSAVGHNTDFFVTIEAFDLNGRVSSATLNLLNDDRGPVLNLTNPVDQDSYRFNISVQGSVENDVGDNGLDEVDFATLRYEVPAKGDVVWALDQGGDFFSVFNSGTARSPIPIQSLQEQPVRSSSISSLRIKTATRPCSRSIYSIARQVRR
jgi:hypothetical protein